MADIQSIHTVYRPQTPAAPQVPATNGTYPAYPQQPAYPTYPQQPTDAYNGSYPPYPQTQVPGSPYPGYPQTAPVPTQGQGMLATVARYLGGIFAGKSAAGIMKKASSAARRSQNRRYYDSYGLPMRRQSNGRARVGTAGRAGSEFFGAIKTSVIVGSIASIVGNVWDVVQKKQTGASAGANIVGDVMSSAVGGAAAAGASALGTMMFAGALSTTGMALPLVGMAFGLVGFLVADGVLRNTNFFKSVQNKVYTMLA